MQDKCYIVISGKVDATIREYQSDVDFKIFHTIDELRDHVEKNPIRAQILFFTEDIIGVSNTAFSILAGLVDGNDFLSVDRVIYICDEDSETIRSIEYLIEDKHLETWELIKGPVTRAFIQEVINGTYRDDNYNAKRKVVVRRPRADYVKQQLKNHTTLGETYVDDDTDLGGIPDEDLIIPTIEDVPATLQFVYIASNPSRERTAFALLAAQYISKSHRVIILESDPEYHTLTEFATKAKIDAAVVTVSDIYEDVSKALENIRKADSNLVIVECIDRVDFDYKYLSTLLYYNLESDFDYFIVENIVEDVPEATELTIIFPSTITGVLQVMETIDKSRIPYCDFVGVDLGDLPETHVSSGVVMSKLLCDLFTERGLVCPVIRVDSLRLDGSAYDFGIMLGRSLRK